MTAPHALQFESKPVSGRHPGLWGGFWFGWLVLSFSLRLAGEEVSVGKGATVPFRFGFSSQMFTDVNENDIKAAIKVWAQTLVKERQLAVEMLPSVFNGTDKITQAMHDRQTDALVLTNPRFSGSPNLSAPWSCWPITGGCAPPLTGSRAGLFSR
jgi:hypothetical protein